LFVTAFDHFDGPVALALESVFQFISGIVAIGKDADLNKTGGSILNANYPPKWVNFVCKLTGDYGAMNILQVGAHYGTSLHRIHALERLGHDVFCVDPLTFIPSNRLVSKWVHDTGAWGLARHIKKHVLSSVENMCFDLVFVDGGFLINPSLVRALRQKFVHVVNFNHDDPFSKPEWNKWRLYRNCVPEYDVLVVVRLQNIEETRALGAKYVLHVFRMADEIAHKPLQLTPEEYSQFGSEVCFMGTWFPERGPFMARLIEKGTPLSIWGDRWHKAKEWPIIKQAWRGPGVFSEDYGKVLAASKICLGLLSKGNRDLHTTRSIEIPAVGGLFCAERTNEHLEMYKEGKEAVFWQDADECVEVCNELLKNLEKREKIAAAGHQRCLQNNYFSEPTLKKIIDFTLEQI